MSVEIRRATVADLDELAGLMSAYYAFDGHRFQYDAARRAMEGLLADGALGRVWIVCDGDRGAGYLALTLGYSLELGGRDAFIDELFLAEAYRGRGLGKRVLEEALAEARKLGVRAVHLEVVQGNDAATALYRRFGFRERPHRLMTKRLDRAAESPNDLR